MKFDGIIFDVDGTLWDSTYIVKDAWNEAIMSAGYADPGVTADRLKGLFGLPMDDIIKDIMPTISKEERQALSPIVHQYEQAYLKEKAGKIYDGILDVIKELATKIPVYIVSNCHGGYIELFMSKTNTQAYITDHLCPADSGVNKAENISILVKKYHMEHPLYVGDTVMDEQACKKAGCPYCFVTYGFGKADKPDYVIDRPIELLSIINE